MEVQQNAWICIVRPKVEGNVSTSAGTKFIDHFEKQGANTVNKASNRPSRLVTEFQFIRRTKDTIRDRDCDTRSFDRNNLTFADLCPRGIHHIDGFANPDIRRTCVWLGPLQFMGARNTYNIIARQTVRRQDADRVPSTDRARLHNKAEAGFTDASDDAAARHITISINDCDLTTDHRTRCCLVITSIADLNGTKVNFETESRQHWISCTLVGRSNRAQRNGIRNSSRTIRG